MSKMGRVIQDIMERFDGNPPIGYTLENYFRDVEKDRIRNNKDKKTEEDGSGSNHNDDEDATQS